MQKYLKLFHLLILAVCFLPLNTFAQEQLWQSFTNMRLIRGYNDAGRPYTFSRLMVSSPQGVWAATTGGILLWDNNRQAFRKFNNTDGLSQNDTKAIGRDRRGRLWIALANGLIDVYDFDNDVFSRIDDYRPNNRRIYDFLTKGDSMYIALDVGISLYDVARNEVKETYQNLGEKFPRASVVTSLFNDGRELWAATNNGVARTSLDLPNLFAPESWTNYTMQEGLPSVLVNGFAKLGQSIVAATANGVAVFNGQRWSDISTGLAEREIRQLITASENNRPVLYAATPFGVYRSEALGQWAPVGSGFPTTLTGIIIDNSGKLWASTYDAGLYEYDRPAQTWRLHEPEGPAATIIASVSLDADGNVWCTSTTSGFQVYDGASWYNYNSRNFPGVAANDVRYSIHLSNGEHWLGTWGAGVYVLTGPPNALSVKKHFDVASGLLSTALGTTNYPVVAFLKQDAQDNIWILNYNAANTNALVAYAPSQEYRHFSTGDGLNSQEVTVLEIEKTTTADRIWVGTVNSGLSVLDHNGTVLDKADDDFSGELDMDDNLLSNRIVSLAQDRDGYMWIGTDKGLHYWFGGGGANDRFCYSLINDDVKVVRVDPRNNKWVGTSAGITVLSGEDNCSTTHYTIENSPIVGNFVTSLAFNTTTGDVWIGTTTGLSRYRTPFTEPRPDLSQLTGYPNPFLLDEQSGACGGQAGFRITNLAENSAVKIFSTAGEMVRSFSTEQVPGAQVCWDGRDQSGQLVPSGVYLFVAFNEETSASAVGKVAVVRR